MPMVENDEITGTMRGDGENDPVSEFIGMFFNLRSILFSPVNFHYLFYSLLQSKLRSTLT